MNNKNERLIDSFGNIDDDIIESSLNYKKTITPWKKYVSIAACFAFVVVSVGIGWMFFGNKSSLDGFYDGNVPVYGGPTNKNENEKIKNPRLVNSHKASSYPTNSRASGVASKKASPSMATEPMKMSTALLRRMLLSSALFLAPKW